MTVHTGTNPHTAFQDDDGKFVNIPLNDQIRLKYLGGGVPVAAISWGPWGTSGEDNVRSWRWLHDHGYNHGLVRVYLPPGGLIEPVSAVEQVATIFQEAEQGLFDAKAQWGNEGNNEYGDIVTPAGFNDWCMACLAEWRRVLPSKPFYAAAPAQDNHFMEWVQAMDPLFRAANGIAIHFYFGRHPGDMEPGYEGSPEWWHERYPDKMLWITECANWTDRDDVQAMYARWARLPYVEGFADWKMSGNNDAEFNWTDDHTNVMAAVCKDWRAVRSFPAGSSPPPEPPASEVDRWRLREHISPQYELCKRMRTRVAADDWAGAASDAKEIEDRAAAIWSEFDLANATP